VLLALLLGLGSLRFGWVAQNALPFNPLLLMLSAVFLPLLAAGFDQLYVSTVLRYTDPISISLFNISTTAEWLVSPDGSAYRSTRLSATSNLLWFISMGYMLVLFFFSHMFGRRSDKNNLATV
jgi:hypothetical protein